eukprot:8132463-Pyramimonas_sp.AAC.1
MANEAQECARLAWHEMTYGRRIPHREIDNCIRRSLGMSDGGVCLETEHERSPGGSEVGAFGGDDRRLVDLAGGFGTAGYPGVLHAA